jgi:hypothetical protein
VKTKLSRRATIVILGAALVVVAAIVIPLELAGNSGGSATASTSGANRCANSGCSVVDLTRRSPEFMGFYGESCTGDLGSWFLNVTEGGPNGVPHPAYALRWSFSKSKSNADPSGTVAFSDSNAPITMTLNQGHLELKGTAANGSSVSGTGSLHVQLGGTSSSPTLTIQEGGLTAKEAALGITSPFDTGGHPAAVPIKHVNHLRGC